MNQIKPTWKIAKQISRQHTLLSLLITCSLVVVAGLIAWIIFKFSGFPDAYLALKMFFYLYHNQLMMLILLIHLIPVNLYAIILTLQYQYRNFHIVLYTE